MSNLPAVQDTGEILDLRTGELIDARDIPKVVDLLSHLRDLRGQVSAAIAACSEAVVAESARQGTKTFRVGGSVASVAGGTEIVWDLEILHRLQELGLPEARWNELVSTEVSYKVSAQVAKQIAGANPEYAKVIEAARQDVPKKQYVKVGRS